MHKFSDFLLNNDKASASLQKILEREGIDPCLSLEDLIAVTQKEWLRPAQSERWHLEENKNKTDRAALVNLFKKIGLVSPIFPLHKQYNYVLFMGGDTHGMQERLDFLIHLVKDGIAIKELVF